MNGSGAKTARTRSVGTKLTEDEYARLEPLAAARGLTVGEWVRQIVLEVADGERAPSGAEQALMAEVIALRTIVLNALFDLASGESIETERMRELIAQGCGEQRRGQHDRGSGDVVQRPAPDRAV